MRLIVLSLLITWRMASLDRVIGCSVTPSAAVVLAGNSISVTCRSASGEYVNLWRRQNENRTVYASQSRITNRFVAEGYSVDDSNPNEVTLTLQNASIQSVDNYECSCLNPTTNAPSSDYTYITVIQTEPLFIVTNSLSSFVPMTLLCSLKFAGNATLLTQINNSAGKVLAELNKRIITNGSQQFNLYYNTSVAIENIYFCNISLASDAIDPKTTIFSRNLNRTVQFSVRNVSISPESPERCQNGGFCETNSVILCKAEGNPQPTYSFTIIYQNGTTEISPTDKYTVKYVGQQVIQCTASNEINGNMYTSQSTSFTTNGTVERLVPEGVGSSNGALIGGLVGGLVGGLLLILIIVVIIVCYTRQKNGLNSKNEGVYTRPQVSQSPNERESPYTDLDLSNNATVTDTRNDRSTTGSYDFVI